MVYHLGKSLSSKEKTEWEYFQTPLEINAQGLKQQPPLPIFLLCFHAVRNGFRSCQVLQVGAHRKLDE